MPNSFLNKAVIKFKYKKTEQNIALYRYTDKWTKLSAKKIDEDSVYSHYEAESPGLSIFAIGKEKEVTKSIAPLLERPANILRKIIKKEEITRKDLMLYGIIPLVIILSLIILFIYSLIRFAKKHKTAKYGLLFIALGAILAMLYLKLERDIFYYAIIPLTVIGLVIIIIFYAIFRLLRR